MRNTRRLVSNGQTVGAVLPVEHLVADSEPRTPVSYSSLIVNIALSRLVLEIFACDRHRQTDRPTDGQRGQLP